MTPIVALEHHEGLAVANHAAVVHSGKTAAVAQIVDGVEHVGFPLPVVANETVDAAREVEPRLGDVLKIEYGNMFEHHSGANLQNNFGFPLGLH